MHRSRVGFTLIELLVVITIIVVLLALLTPALDKAIYQAELVTDGANIDATTSGVLAYAFDHRRRYPYRGEVQNRQAVTGYATHPIKIKDPILGLDDRPALRGYLTINKMFMDPLGPGDVDLENSHDDTHVYSTYAIWWGWSWGRSPAGPEAGMSKVGDRFSWTEGVGAGSVRRRFSVLIGDFDRIAPDQNYNSHTDRGGVVGIPHVRQDQAAVGMGSVGAIKQTLAFWIGTPGVSARALIDMNFGFDDGSVSRYSDVKWDQYADEGPLVRVPEYPEGANYPGNYLHLPAR